MEFEGIKILNEGSGIVEISSKEAQRYYEDHYKELVTDVEHMELKGDARRKEKKMEKILEEVKQERIEIKEKIKKYKQRLKEGGKFYDFRFELGNMFGDIEFATSIIKIFIFFSSVSSFQNLFY